MSTNLITGYAGKSHITSAGDGAVNAAVLGNGRYVLDIAEKFAYELISNNQIRIKSGYAVNQGRKIELAVNDYEELTIDNGLQGVKRCDLIAITYEKNLETGIETAVMNVIKGTSGDDYLDPEHTVGNILNGDAKDDFLLYRVKINGLSIESVEKLFEVRKSLINVLGTTDISKIGNGTCTGAISSLNDGLAKCLSVDGQHATYNPVSDLNGFYNGIGLFTAPTLNMPGDGWYLIISSGVPNTVCQRAVNLFGGSACYRYCASNNWSSWAVDNYLPVSGGTITGNISTNGGATFATDGNVYLNSNGYKDWLTNILNSKLSTSASCNKNWNWSGKNETPAWIWGGSDGTNMYVYNPTYILVQGIRNRVTNRAMTITDDNHVRTYESNGVGMNGAISLGSGNYRFSQLYVTSSSISTSDKNYKDDIKSLTDKHLQFFMKLQPVSFLFKDGTSGRTHIGFIAQDVEQAMSECDLTDLDFAGFCKDQKIDSKLVDGEEVNEPILDENGNPEYIYSLRYEEFIALNTYVIQELWNRVEILEKENAEMRDQIKSIQQDIAELKKSRA